MGVNWRTVSEQIDHAAVGVFCAEQWGGDPDSLSLINLGINAVYRFTRNGGDGYYLRLSHLTMRPLDEWTAATDYLVHLAQHEVPVCRPVRSHGGQWIEAMHQDGLEFWGTVVTEAPGDLMHVDHADLRVYEVWGRSLGLLHRAARDYVPDPALPFKTIDSIWHNVTPTAHDADNEIRTAFETISAWWAGLPRHDFGLTHADHRPGNVIWDGTTARIVDFDEPVYHWFVSDIARAMLAFSDQPLERRIAVRDAFLRGYRAVTDLDLLWVDLLPEFMQWRGLLMHLWDLQFVSGGNFETLDPMIRRWAVTRFAF